MHRLFVALRPPPAIRALLLAAAGDVPRARWQDDEQLHLTLRFVGDVERPVAEEIAIALAQVNAAPVEIAIAGIGAFDRRGRIDTLWAGVAPHDALAALHRKIDRALVRLGLPPERRAYLPHVTLARLPRGAGAGAGVEIERWRADRATLASPPFEIGHFGLYESRLGGEGARYETIARWPLAG